MNDYHYYSPQAVYGRELKACRKLRGMTQLELANAIYVSDSLISGIETGHVPASEDVAKDCDRVLETSGALIRLLDLQKAKGMYPTWFRDWLVIEEKATVLRAFDIDLVYGLLQTPNYVRAIFKGNESDIEGRMARQGVLQRNDPSPPLLYCVLDEAALRRDVGGADVMHEQLMALADAPLPNVTVQVVPTTLHRGTRGPFVIATLPDGSDVAYTESAFGGVMTAAPSDLATAYQSWEQIRNEALPTGMSSDLIRKIAKECWRT